MWWFEDTQGNIQLTGVGLLMVVFFTTIIVVLITDMVKKFIFYRSEYYSMKKELEELQKILEKKLPTYLEHYYQSRKEWEKKNALW